MLFIQNHFKKNPCSFRYNCRLKHPISTEFQGICKHIADFENEKSASSSAVENKDGIGSQYKSQEYVAFYETSWQFLEKNIKRLLQVVLHLRNIHLVTVQIYSSTENYDMTVFHSYDFCRIPMVT